MVNRQLAVVDLDGTYAVGNTLHDYLRSGFIEACLDGRFIGALKIGALVGLRALRLISHRTLKFKAAEYVRPTEKLYVRFIESVRANGVVIALIDRLEQQGVHILLATAALDIYVPWLWPDDDYLATPVAGNPDRHELRGQAKAAAVSEYARRNGMSLYAVITDHTDDLPLLALGAPHNYLVNPSQHTITAVKMAGIKNVTVLVQPK